MILIHKKWSVHRPLNGWSELNKVIADNKIMSLPPGKTTEELKGTIPTHASWVQFEISINGKYRYYEYFEPAYYREVDAGSNNVYTFLSYLNKVFCINDLYTTSDSFVLKPDQ